MTDNATVLIEPRSAEILADAAILFMSALHNEPHPREKFIAAFVTSVVMAEQAHNEDAEHHRMSLDALDAARLIDLHLRTPDADNGAVAQ